MKAKRNNKFDRGKEISEGTLPPYRTIRLQNFLPLLSRFKLRKLRLK